MNRDKRYLSDIYQCVLLIEEYTIDGQETFMNTCLIQDGVIRNFEIIGEATKRLSESKGLTKQRVGLIFNILSKHDRVSNTFKNSFMDFHQPNSRFPQVKTQHTWQLSH